MSKKKSHHSGSGSSSNSSNQGTRIHDLENERRKWQEQLTQVHLPLKEELRVRLANARRSVRREFPRDNLIRTENDPFTGDKIYKNRDGTRATYHTKPIVAKEKPKGPTGPFRYHVQTHTYFDNPLRVAVCHARKLRRRIMFALDLVRRASGSGGGKRHRFTETSKIRCK